MHKVVINTAEH